MPRVKRGSTAHKRHKRILRQAKGYYGTRSRLIKTAREAVERGWRYSYRDRRQRKRQFRILWIARINAAVREHGLSYSRFMHGLQNSGVLLNRKMLSQIAIDDPSTFDRLVEMAGAQGQ